MNVFKNTDLTLRDEHLAYIYTPLAPLGSYELWYDMEPNYKAYAQQLEEYDLGPNMLSTLAIKYYFSHDF